MSLSQRVAKNTIIQVIGKIVSVVLALIAIGLITRFLGTEGFGEYTTALAFLSFFGVLADMGLCTILAREISRDEKNKEQITSNIFTIRLVADIITFTFVPLIALGFNYSSSLKQTIAIGALAFLFVSSAQVLQAIFQKELRVDKVAIAEIVGKATFLILSVSIIKFAWDNTSRSFMAAMVCGDAVLLFLSVLFARKFIKFQFRFDFSYWKKIFIMAVPMSLAIVFNRIYFKIDTILLSILKPVADVGIYGLPYKILEVLIFTSAIFVGIIFPLLSKYLQEDKEKFRAIFKYSQDTLLIISIPLLFGGVALANPIIILLGGSDFIASVAVFRILLFAVVIMFLNALISHVIISAGKEKSIAWIHCVGAILSVLTNIIFIPLYTYIGASGTTIFVEFVMLVLGYIIIKKTFGYIPSFKIIYKILLSASVMLGGLILLLKISPIVSSNVYIYAAQLLAYVLIGIIIYGITLLSVGGINKQMFKKLFARS